MLADLPGPVRVARLFGRLVVYVPQDVPWRDVAERLGRVFGVASFAPVHEVTPPEVELLEAAVVARARMVPLGRFAVRARRVGDRFPLDSLALNRRLGTAIQAATGAPVDLTRPDTTVRVEVLDDRILFGLERVEGPGGLPVGTSGEVLCLLSGGIDSPVAAWLMMKRGLIVHFIHFHSHPYTDAESQRKALDLARLLTRCQFACRLYMVPFVETQRTLVTGAPAELRVLLYRRFMLRIAEVVARRERLQALVTGDAVGQVASQTLSNLAAIEAAVDLPVLRPLVGFDKVEIVTLARRIGTFDLSVEPHGDCCSFLMPRAPATRSSAGALAAVERRLDVEALVAGPLEHMEVHEVAHG
jgi:thiamine biosynthesis protein ThiI